MRRAADLCPGEAWTGKRDAESLLNRPHPPLPRTDEARRAERRLWIGSDSVRMTNPKRTPAPVTNNL